MSEKDNAGSQAPSLQELKRRRLATFDEVKFNALYTTLGNYFGHQIGHFYDIEDEIINNKKLLVSGLYSDKNFSTAAWLLAESLGYNVNERVNDSVMSQIGNNLPIIESRISGNELEDVGYAVYLLGKASRYTSRHKGTAQKSLQILSQRKDALINAFGHKYHSSSYYAMEGMQAAHQHFSKEDRAELEQKLREFIGSQEERNEELDYIRLLRSSDWMHFQNLGEHLIREKVVTLGHNSSFLMSSWRMSSYENATKEYDKQHDFARIIESNLRTLLNLADKNPEISHILLKDFGIRNFGRYTQETLVGQYENRNNKKAPYGIVYAANGDHKEAFYGNAWLLHTLSEKLSQLYQPHLLRISEGMGGMDLAVRTARFNRVYGETQLMKFAILGAHGNPWGMQFNMVNKKDETRLESEDLDLEIGNKIMQYFIPHPTLILNSCMTGAGFAQDLSRKTNSRVIAPLESAAIRDITPYLEGEELNFHVEYLQELWRKATTKIFDCGKEIQ